MNKIIVYVQPFTMQQKVYIYKDGESIEYTFNDSIANLKDTCYNLCKSNNIHNLVLKGHNFIISKIEKELTATKYNNFDINIELINE